MALPRLAAAIEYRGGIPTVRGQDSFSRGGIPTVRGQPLRVGTFVTVVASPQFAVKFCMAAPFLPRWHPRGSRMGLVRSSRPLLLMLVDVACVDGSDWIGPEVTSFVRPGYCLGQLCIPLHSTPLHSTPLHSTQGVCLCVFWCYGQGVVPKLHN